MATTKRKLTQRQAAVKHGWRSGLEERVAEQLDSLGVAFTYEKLQLGYIQPESKHLDYWGHNPKLHIHQTLYWRMEL